MRTLARSAATLLAVAAASGGLVACGGDDTDPQDIPPATGQRPDAAPDQSGVKNVVARAGEVPELSRLERAIAQADLLGALQTRTSVTIFAPSDEAFASTRGAELLTPGSPDELRRALERHIVPRRLPAARLTDGLTVETLSGDTLRIGRSDGKVTVDGVPIETADLRASNGVIHVIPDLLDATD